MSLKVTKQQTIGKDISLTGVGLHTGMDVTLTLSQQRSIMALNLYGLI